MVRVLAIDIGTGTKDILLYDSGVNLRNCVKMVLTSPILVYARMVEGLREDLFVHGYTVGGGPFARALVRHVEKGYKVYMTGEAAYTVRGNLEEVAEAGIEVVDSKPDGFKGATLYVDEVDIPSIRTFIETCCGRFDVDFIAVAVQDHGTPPRGRSARRFRFSTFKRILSKHRSLDMLSFTPRDIPPYYKRMSSASKACGRFASKGVLVMDTSFSAILGCMSVVEGGDPTLLVNMGNSHTVCAVVDHGELAALMEHHTKLLTPRKLLDFTVRLADGELTDEEVYLDGGHGAITIEKVGFDKIRRILVTGPNMTMFKETGLKFEYAAPGGDIMMAGVAGLLQAASRRFGFKLDPSIGDP